MSTRKQLLEPLNKDTYDKSYLGFKKPYDLQKVAYRLVDITYSENGSTSGGAPAFASTGTVVKVFENVENNKVTAMVVINNEEIIEFLSIVDRDLHDLAFNNAEHIYKGISKVDASEYETRDAFDDNMISGKHKGLINYDKSRNSYSMAIEFENTIDITFSDSVSEEKQNASSITDKITKTQIAYIVKANNLSISRSNGEFNIKLKATQIHCFDDAVSGGSSGPRGRINGKTLEEIDGIPIHVKDIEKMDKGKCSRVRMGSNDEKNKANVSFVLRDADVNFIAMSKDYDGKTKTSYSCVSKISDTSVIDDIDNEIFKQIASGLKGRFSDLGVKSESKLKKYMPKRSITRNDDSDDASFWASIYAMTDENDNVTAFGSNDNPTFYLVENDEYTPLDTEDVINRVFGHKGSIRCDISYYLRFIWYGADQFSIKWYVGKVNVYLDADVQYNMQSLMDNIPDSSLTNDDINKLQDSDDDSDANDSDANNSDANNSDANNSDNDISD